MKTANGIWGYREQEPLGGHDPYSTSKACAELVAAAYRRSFSTNGSGLRIASARAGNVVGGGDWAVDRLVPDLIRGFASNDAVAIRNPDAIRPWQHVLEPINGYMTLAERLSSPEGERYASPGILVQDLKAEQQGLDRGRHDRNNWDMEQLGVTITEGKSP